MLSFDLGKSPAEVERASLRIRWDEKNDFSSQYTEHWEDGDHWECRWDRHPNTHSAREHFHSPPDAATPGTDEPYSEDWRDVTVDILGKLDARIMGFWR